MESESIPQVSASSNNNNNTDLDDINDRPAKRVKMDESTSNGGIQNVVTKDEGRPRDDRDTKKGQAPIKAE
jgi:hypothetical protein